MKCMQMAFLLRFKEPLFSGVKTKTSRLKKLGDPGDIFYFEGVRFLINGVERRSLAYVSRNCWKEEGCISPEDFREVWTECYPRIGWDPVQMVWVHSFERMHMKGCSGFRPSRKVRKMVLADVHGPAF